MIQSYGLTRLISCLIGTLMPMICKASHVPCFYFDDASRTGWLCSSVPSDLLKAADSRASSTVAGLCLILRLTMHVRRGRIAASV